MLIPISGKPGDIDLSNISTIADADRVLLWLGSVLKDMTQQVVDAGAEADPVWLKKLRSAQRATTNLRHRVLELRDSLLGQMSLYEAVASAAASALSEDALDAISAWIEKNTPHLSGLDLKSLAKDQPV